MQLDVYANVFRPLGANEPYLIVASAFPCEQGNRLPIPTSSSAIANTFEEAVQKGRELAQWLRESLESRGDVVRTVQVR